RKPREPAPAPPHAVFRKPVREASPPMTRIFVDDCKRDPARALRILLRYLPLSLCVREIMRLRALSENGSLEAPLLDVGCGDGLFWQAVGDAAQAGADRLDGLVGIDVNPHEL